MSALPNNSLTANTSNGNGSGSGNGRPGGLAGGVKKKVTKKRRNLLTSQSDDCQADDETEQATKARLGDASDNKDRHHINGGDDASPVHIDSQSNKSDSDIMFIEHYVPSKPRASTNTPVDGSSTTTPSPLLRPPPTPQAAVELSQPQTSSSSFKSTSSQLSSSQSIPLSSTPNPPSASPLQSSSVTPPPPVEIERAQLKKQIHEAIQNQQSIKKTIVERNDQPAAKPPAAKPLAATSNDLASLAQFRTPSDSLQMPQSSISPSRADNSSSQQSKSPASSQKKTPKKSFYDTRGSLFSWNTYLEMFPAEPAPKEAFRQPKVYPKNEFRPGMKLQAKDPRKASDPQTAWALATVVFVEGLHIRLRFLGTDAMNDLYELIDSENIRPLDDNIDSLYAPAGYNGNIGLYQKFVEKAMRKDLESIAPPTIFHETPRKPKVNMFRPGMKLEAVDRKNRDFVYPATIGEVSGDKIKVVFDGWRGSFDYYCEYYSRDIFPINWCRDVGRPIQAPNGWLAMLEKGVGSSTSPPFYSALNEPAASSLQATKKLAKASGGVKKLNKGQNKRGRPKGATSKKVSTSKIYNSTPKGKELSGFRSPKTKSVEPIANGYPLSSGVNDEPRAEDKVEEDNNYVEDPDDDDQAMPVDPYQCQRTVAYKEWRQKKKLEEKVPRQESISDKGGQDQSADLSSSSLSDTLSMASSLPMSRDSRDFNGYSNKVKKPKTGDSSSCSIISICGKLKQILATKPKKLSKWSVEDVIEIIKTEDSLGKYVQVFQENEIDGLAFGLFGKQKTELLMQMGLKMGPVLKVLDLRERVIPHLDMSDILKA